MSLVDYRVADSSIHILTLQNKTNDNWFTLEFMKCFNESLDKIEEWIKGNPLASTVLITISSNSKIYSNGLFLNEAFEKGSLYFSEYSNLLKRLLVFPIPTIAGTLSSLTLALNGHAFAGGCMFALAHDYRVMRGDRGYICMNEVDLPAALTPGMLSLIRSKVPMKAFRNMILQGHRFTAQESLENGFVDEIALDSTLVLPLAIELGKKWAQKAKAGPVYGYLKAEMYSEAVHHLKSGRLAFVSIATGIPEAKL